MPETICFMVFTRLEALRKKNGLTQTELAFAVGIHAPDLGKYERGHKRPAYKTLEKLARCLGVEDPATLLLPVEVR